MHYFTEYTGLKTWPHVLLTEIEALTVATSAIISL